MEIDHVWLVMKWVLLVLLAGFIGQFGKSLAQQVLRKVRGEKGAPAESRDTPVVQPPAAPPDHVSAPEDHRAAALEKPPVADKKQLKTLAKLKKKESKALAKKD